ncbi:hypothetical protein Sango_1160700 [Sesamum angolense]|uniref:Reverse transcriptase zinc-binding domain-containing protein n=1 Tax=Sesamum angolense TaxID=2727404 RepID=A0AAE1WW74_9LAMI|nr:hypothetical protein Sango_1160700 [Sesamum angolense]
MESPRHTTTFSLNAPFPANVLPLSDSKFHCLGPTKIGNVEFNGRHPDDGGSTWLMQHFDLYWPHSVLSKLESMAAKFFSNQDCSGTLINVVGSLWLPRLPTFKLISRSRSLPMSTFVLRLLNANRSWNLDLVRNEFGSLDTECILQVSTRSAPKSDRVIWHVGKKGTFSISSIYKLVAERAEEASSSSIGTCSGTAGNWFFISKAKVPPKVLMFAWRCCKNALPSYSKLLSRGIRLDGNCLCYNLMEDGLDHVLR